jgi:O-antigen ligase
MDFPAWDETVLANNLYLEILSGNGILGLASFLWLLWEFGRVLAARVVLAGSPLERSSAYFGAMYLSAFTLHGLVDYFLKFTPTFLLFWLLLGTLCAVGGDNRGTHANRI